MPTRTPNQQRFASLRQRSPFASCSSARGRRMALWRWLVRSAIRHCWRPAWQWYRHAPASLSPAWIRTYTQSVIRDIVSNCRNDCHGWRSVSMNRLARRNRPQLPNRRHRVPRWRRRKWRRRKNAEIYFGAIVPADNLLFHYHRLVEPHTRVFVCCFCGYIRTVLFVITTNI